MDIYRMSRLLLKNIGELATSSIFYVVKNWLEKSLSFKCHVDQIIFMGSTICHFIYCAVENEIGGVQQIGTQLK